MSPRKSRTDACRLLLATVVALSVAVYVALLSVSALAAEPSGAVGFSFGSEAWVGQPVSITVSGTSSQAGELAVYKLSPGAEAAQCPDVSKAEDVVLGDLAPPVSVPAGNYSESYSVTPEYPTTYAFCAYLSNPASGVIYAQGGGGFTAAYHVEKVGGGGETGTTESGETGSSTGGLGSGSETEPGPPPHLSSLSVKVRDRRGTTARRPGRTILRIRVTPRATLRLVLKRHGHTRRETFSLGVHSSGKRIVRWSCSSPGGVYHFRVTATDAYGKTLTRRGKFHPVTAARCRALRAADARRRQEEARRQAREAEEEAREEVEKQKRFEENCRAEGGEPAVLHGRQGEQIVCRSPGGGLLPVYEHVAE